MSTTTTSGSTTRSSAATAKAKRPQTIKSADRTVDVLEALAQSPRRLTLSELQRELNVPKSSLHGLLQTLVLRGWVDTDDRGDAYGVGLSALRIGSAFLDRDPTVQAGEALLAHLGREFDETMHLARLDGADVVYLASRESQHHIRERSLVGRRLPAHATALGQAILSTREWPEVDRILPVVLTQAAPNTITDRKTLKATLDEARSRGWAQEVGQVNPGLMCVATAIPLIGPSTDAISSSIPIRRATDEHVEAIVHALQQTARDLSLINGGIRR